MRRPLLCAVLVLVLPCALVAQEPYRTPPQVIVDMVDALPLPAASVSPDRQWVLLIEQPALPSIAELSAPMLRLAGARINPSTNGPRVPGRVTGLLLKRVSDGSERRITVPEDASLGFVSWSPDGRRIAFAHTRADGIELWVADAATGAAKAITGPVLNAVDGAPCRWMPDSGSLLCRLVPEGRGAAPLRPATPVGPVIQEAGGRAAPVPTFQDLLDNAYDESLYDYYFTMQLARVDAASGAITTIGQPAVIDLAEPAPGGEYLLVVRTTRPYSYQVPAGRFPKKIEVWNPRGAVVRQVAELDLAENVPIRGVRQGPRAVAWRAGAAATLQWAEALDEGNPANKVPHQDRVVTLAAPFTGEPAEIMRLEKRYQFAATDGRDLTLVGEYDRDRRWSRTWIKQGTAAPRILWDRSAEDRYGNPGTPVTRTDATGRTVILRQGDVVYLSGAGASPQGDRPFVDRLDLKTLKAERVWRSDTAFYEAPLAVLDDAGRSLLTRRESRTSPPNYFVREVRGGRLRALTAYPDPAPQLAGVQKRLITYQREDGVPLSGTLYLPAGYQAGSKLPVVLWAYPTEFASSQAAGQVSATPNRFTSPRGISHLFFLTQGYAVLDDPKMPIIGGDTANNRYVEQLAASARAAVKAVVDLGVADPDRIGVGGHSYGAFMTANLLAHTDLFRAGIARSGAYNRTLTPFGFQNEERTYWEAPEIYDRMSPFQNADKVNEPILLIHGEADNNTGTYPIQSDRFFHALKGLGKRSRFVLLPHEAHGYSGRESVLHTLAEMINWFDTYVKNARPRTDVSSN